MAAIMAYLGVSALILLAVGSSAISLHSGFHWFLLIAIILTASFGIFSLIHYPFGSDPSRQIIVLICAFTFFVLYAIMQRPEAHSFIH